MQEAVENLPNDVEPYAYSKRLFPDIPAAVTAVSILCGLSLALGGCAKDASQRCQALFDAANYEQALVSCEMAYAEDKNPLTLRNAASAAGELDQFDRALNIAEQVRNTSLAGHILGDLARIHWRNGNMEASKKLFERRADVFRNANDDAGLAAALHSLYFFAWQASDHRKALALANDSLQAALRADDADGQAIALSDLYIVFQELGSLGPAELALELVGKKLDDTSAFSHVNYFIYRGALQTKLGRYGMATHEYEQALAVTTGDETPLLLRSLRLNLVKSNMLLGRMDAAREHLAAAQSHAESNGSAQFALNYFGARLDLSDDQPRAARDKLEQALASDDLPAAWIWELHYWAGIAAQSAGQLNVARESFELSIAALDSERKDLAYADMKAYLQNDRREPYEALFNLIAAGGDAHAALAVVEQANARAFVDAFVADSDGTLSKSGKRIPVIEVSDRVDAVRAYVDTMRTSPAVGTRPVAELLSAFRDDVLISYFFAEQSIWAIRVAAGAPTLSKMALSRNELDALLDANRRDPDDVQTLTALGAALLPADLLPRSGQRLFIAPDGDLSRLAFASLRIDDQFLVERFTLAVVPSLNTMVALREARDTAVTRKGRLVLADPRGDLPHATQEAHAVARLLKTEATTGTDASLAHLARAKNADVVHLATHSGLSHLGPWLALAEGNIGANELLGLKLAPSLAVLASCLSGASDNTGLWGSLGGMFLSSGAGSALVALWSIPDNTTQDFVTEFYRAYTTQVTATDALAIAQRAAIADGLAPRLWAGFVLLGGADDV